MTPGQLGLGAQHPAAMIRVVAAVSSVQPVSSAALGTVLARVLDGDRYVLGRSTLNLTSSGGQLLGLTVGGAVIGALGAPAGLLLAAAGYAVAALSLRLGLPDLPAAGSPGERWRLRDTWRGNRELLAEPRLRGLFALWWLPPALFVAAEALVVPYVGEAGAPARTTGWLLASMPVGMLASEVVVGRFCSPSRRERLVRPLLLVMGAALLPLFAHPPLPVVAALLGLASTGFAYQLGRQRAFLDAIPAGRQGLAFGLLSTGLMTGQGLGPVVSGGLADVLGAGTTMSLAGLAIVAAAALLPLGSRRGG